MVLSPYYPGFRMERENDDRAEQTTMIIVDSKSVQNADTGGVKGYDAGKKSPA